MSRDVPFPDSYWVVEGGFLAGEYPGNREAEKACRKVRRLLECGVDTVVDLTEDGEYHLTPYLPMLQQEAAVQGRAVRHHRMAFRDNTVPAPPHVRRVLDFIDAEMGAGRLVYLHCWGGIGRTGTLVACWLVERGRTGEEALATLARWRQGTPDGHRPSPEVGEQRDFVRRWLALRPEADGRPVPTRLERLPDCIVERHPFRTPGHRLADHLVRIDAFEGGALYRGDRDGRPCLLSDEGTMADFLPEDDPMLQELVTVRIFADDAALEQFLGARAKR